MEKTDADGKTTIETITEQKIAQGPVASQQEFIKEWGTNGGGFFNANSAHPFENPTPFTNLLEMFAIFASLGGADLHARANDRFAEARLGGLRRDDGALFRGILVSYWAEAEGT